MKQEIKEIKKELLELLDKEARRKTNTILTERQIESLKFYVENERVPNNDLRKSNKGNQGTDNLHYYKASSRLSRMARINILLIELGSLIKNNKE